MKNIPEFLSLSETNHCSDEADLTGSGALPSDIDANTSTGEAVKRKKRNHKETKNISNIETNSELDNFMSSYAKERGGQEEERFSFLVDVRDKEGRRPSDPEYDPSSLYIPPECFEKLTPFEKQFWSVKSKYYDTIILFKKGKFYELYESDAELFAKLFDFKISGRVNMKMSGFPEKSYPQWAGKLLRLGYKVGRVEQTENTVGKRLREREEKDSGDKLVRRELVEIVTSGTIYEAEDLEAGHEPVYLGVMEVEVNSEKYKMSILLYDASMNRIMYEVYEDTKELEATRTVFVQRNIRELIISRRCRKLIKPLKYIMETVSIVDPDKRESSGSRKYEFPSEGLQRCYGYICGYMKELCRGEAIERADIIPMEAAESMTLSGSTLKSLDMLTNNDDGSGKGSLFSAINYCVTPMGIRMLKKWLLGPLSDKDSILKRRKEAVIFYGKDLSEFTEKIMEIGDIERKLGRLSNTSPTLKNLTALLEALKKSVAFMEYFLTNFSDCEENLGGRVKSSCESISDFIRAFTEAFRIEEEEIEPGETNQNKKGVDNENKEVEQELGMYIRTLRKKTGIIELRYKNLNKDAYLIEAPSEALLPPEFSVVSMTKTHKRYYSPELRALVRRKEEVDEKLFQIRGNALRNAIEFVKSCSESVDEVALLVAILDCYASFSKFSASSHMSTEPVFVEWEDDKGCEVEIKGVGSPVYSRNVQNDFVPKNRITIVTGPNMGGKSTFLRTVALNIILAQMGMNVIAEFMQLPVFDQIFTRIGASDSLARGESTFMAELLETSRILHKATSRSFVIMDELGRGTSTEDGAAIARAVLDHMKKRGAYVLFSTHYHDLVSMYDGVDKAYVDSQIDGDSIVFLYKIRPGVCMNSHGLEVAKLAGIPEAIIQAARIVREELVKEP